MGYSPEVIRQLAEAEAERGKFKPDLDGLHELEKQMVRTSSQACELGGTLAFRLLGRQRPWCGQRTLQGTL